jgi:SAM-dependent methyltransferase
MHAREYEAMRAVEDSHFWYRALHGHVEALLARHAPDAQNILDAGCGTGGMAARLERAGKSVTALDLREEALAPCRERGLTRVVSGSVDALPFPDDHFDAVLSLDVWCHRAVDDHKAVREALRVLKPGGTLLLNLPAYDNLRGHHDIVVETARRYDKKTLKGLLNEPGLEIRFTTHWNTTLFPLLAISRLMSRITPKKNEDQSDVAPVNPAINAALLQILTLERNIFLKNSLPYGLSLLTVARKPDP